MVEYNKINVKLSNLQLSKLKNAVKNNEGTILRISSKMFNSQDFPHELFLTQRQIIKLKTDVKLSRAQIKKIIMSGGALGSVLGKLIGPLTKVAKPLIKKNITNIRIICCNKWN